MGSARVRKNKKKTLRIVRVCILEGKNVFSRRTVVDHIQSRPARRYGVHRHVTIVHDRVHMRFNTQVCEFYLKQP